MVECPLCGKPCKNYHYLGQHVKNKNDALHNGNAQEENQEDPDLEDTIEETYSDDGSEGISWDEDETDDGPEVRELTESDPVEKELINEGFKYVEKDPDNPQDPKIFRAEEIE